MSTEKIDNEQEDIKTSENKKEKKEKKKEKKVSLKDYEKLESELDTLQSEYEKLSNTYQRILADYENHKRRSAGELLSEKTKGKEEVLKQLLDIVDNFERALGYDIQTEEFKSGIEMVHNMLNERLTLVGLKEVETEGKLNPDLHQAITIVNEEDKEDDHIVQTLQKGYYVDEKLIRPAMVIVNKKD